ncbi:hypothetical protein CEE36_04345 [candidate division TA06 bacterium B3_TA06]|uniref:DUF4268 domain-containing protein n=1 Tax=candidate division TA06 bacterium B3_TA06 TaxID=2012487 RepID=A0A532V7V7_UNCT6|nr:MAG: hypothetical protein CEE36_04345 [candidate division TA06 bacterium B3_TA06]
MVENKSLQKSRRRRKSREKESTEIGDPAVEFLRKKYKCDGFIRQLRLKGGHKVDIVAFSSSEKVFYIGECKRVAALTTMAKALGQIIGYYCLIENYGAEFREGFIEGCENKGVKIPLSLMDKTMKVIPIKLFVAFNEKGMRRYSNLLDDLFDKFEPHIGLLKVNVETKKVTEDLERPIPRSSKPVPYTKRFNSQREFYFEMAEELKRKYKEIFEHLEIDPRYFKLHLSDVPPYFHFELNFRNETRMIEIGLHLESPQEVENRQIFEKLQKETQTHVSNFRFQDNWPKNEGGGRGKRRIYSYVKWDGDNFHLTNKLMEELLQILDEYIRTFKEPLRKTVSELGLEYEPRKDQKEKIEFLEIIKKRIEEKLNFSSKLKKKYNGWITSHPDHEVILQIIFWHERSRSIHFEIRIPYQGIWVLLDLESEDLNKKIYDCLKEKSEEIEEKLGKKLIGKESELPAVTTPRDSKRIGERFRRGRSLKNMEDFIVTRMVEYIKVLAPVVIDAMKK